MSRDEAWKRVIEAQGGVAEANETLRRALSLMDAILEQEKNQ